ncbi:MAG TPA: kelch repeat-containing protein [Humisphaera sp.]|nr:kelch repeat-containing protein [Humisphaera sp.]
MAKRKLSLSIRRRAHPVDHVERLEGRQLLSAAAAPTALNGISYAAGQTIEAENFDKGGEGVAYHNPGRRNPASQTYRADTTVGIVKAGINTRVPGGASNGRYVGYTSVGEWLDYSITVPVAGAYALGARVADISAGATFHATIDGTLSTSELSIPHTPTWTSWHTVESKPIALSAGSHVLRIAMDRSSAGVMSVGNYDSFILVAIATSSNFDWKPGPASTEKQFEPRAAVVQGQLYTFGGYTAVNPFGANDTFQVYNPITNRWKNLGDMPIPQTHSGIAADDATGMIYFVGGLRGLYPGTATTDVWDYNTQTNVWKRLPSLPEPLSAGSSALVNGQLHYFGGNIGQRRDVDETLHFVLDLNALAKTGKATWQTAAPLPEIRDHAGAAVVNGKIYLLGGEVGHDTYHLQQSHSFCYDPATNTWTQIADMPIPRSHTEASTFVDNGKIIVAGGQADDYLATNSALEYDPSVNRWYQLANLPIALEGVIVQPIGNEVIVSGGYDGLNGLARNGTYIGVLPHV